MTIQKNEKELSNQPNGPLSFTEEEQKFIEMSFRIVRGQLSHPQVKGRFPNMEMDIENEDHIRFAIKLYHDYFRMPAGKPHQLKDAIFRKLGYWNNGITTLEEYKQKILQEKLDNEKRLAEITLKRKEALSKEIEVIKHELKEIEENPIIYKYDLTKEYEKIEKELQESIKIKEAEQSKKLQGFLQQQQQQFKSLAEEVYKKAEHRKRVIEEEAKKKALLEGKLKLQKAMERIEENTSKSTTKLEETILQRNEMITIELQDLENKTVVELRKFADDNEIDWNYNMRKADLIEHIKNKLNE